MLKLIFVFQKIILHVTSFICSFFVKKDNQLWVVGVDEIANQINFISGAFDKTVAVNLRSHKFFTSNSYDINLGRINISSGILLYLRWLMGPIILGYLINKASNFFYIWNTGFLIHNTDGREYEFAFLKKRNAKIVNFFCGTDIRAIKHSLEQAQKMNMDNVGTYISMLNPSLSSQKADSAVRMTAETSDKYADFIFNASVDQIGYIKREVLPFQYFYPDHLFQKNDEKFNNLDTIKILHAPSSGFIKGTPLVRAAIKKLQLQGYSFEYLEISNQSNEIVLEALKSSHIVVNQLYSFMPGLFSIEAMASHCALITSADRSIETSLPEGAETAWLKTAYWEIYDNLKLLLDEPHKIKAFADSGYDWAWNNCRASHSAKVFRSILVDN